MSPPLLADDRNCRRGHRRLFAWTLLAALGLMAAMAAPFFAGRVYTRDDLGAFHLPVRAFYAEQLARGEPFDWMPQLYSGFYITGEGQAGTYHPWHWLLYRGLPLRAALALEWLSTYPFLLAGTWLFLRRKVHHRGAAMAGSLCFTFSGFNLLHFVHPNAVAVVAHIPWLLWAIDIALVDASRRRVAAARAAIALLTGSQLLLGYPQYVWFSLLAELSYAGFTIAAMRRAAGRWGKIPWPRLLVAKGIGLLLGGVQLVPTLDALQQSVRHSADAAFAAWGSLHPLNLLQFVAPYLFAGRVLGGNTHELGVYLGAAPLLLVACVTVHRRDLGPWRSLVRAAAWLGALSLLLALGEYGPLYRLQQYLPLVNRFRCPCRYLVLFQFAMAVVATVGFLLVQRAGRDARWRRINPLDRAAPPEDHAAARQFKALGCVVLTSAAVALVGLLLQNRWSIIAPWQAVVAGPLLLATAAGLLAAALRGARGALAALVLFTAADLGYYGLSYAVYSHTERLDDFVANACVPACGVAFRGESMNETPVVQDSGRVYAPPVKIDGARLWIGNQMTLAGWQRTDGYTGLEPRRQLDYGNLAALRVASTRWVRRDAATTAILGLVPCGPEWLQVRHPLPRVRLVSRAVASADPARDIDRIDVERAALCEYPLALPASEPGQARLAAERPGRLEIEVNCASPQLLVVAESYHPGWRCTRGGHPCPILRVNGDFLGCLVEPGASAVVLEFRPESLGRGWLATLAGLGLVVVGFVADMRTPAAGFISWRKWT